MTFTNKRGISPLIATVLLISFAVSIGALIMNWSSADTIPIAMGNPTCVAVELSVLSSCQSDTEIALSLKNDGTAIIGGIILRSNDANSINYFIPSSSIGLTENRVIRLSKANFNSDTFDIIPIINSNGNELSCTSKALIVSSLIPC